MWRHLSVPEPASGPLHRQCCIEYRDAALVLQVSDAKRVFFSQGNLSRPAVPGHRKHQHARSSEGGVNTHWACGSAATRWPSRRCRQRPWRTGRHLLLPPCTPGREISSAAETTRASLLQLVGLAGCFRGFTGRHHCLQGCESWREIWEAETVLWWHYEGDEAERHVAYWQSSSS